VPPPTSGGSPGHSYNRLTSPLWQWRQTTLMFEGVATYPDASRLLGYRPTKHQGQQFSTPRPIAIRALMPRRRSSVTQDSRASRGLLG